MIIIPPPCGFAGSRPASVSSTTSLGRENLIRPPSVQSSTSSEVAGYTQQLGSSGGAAQLHQSPIYEQQQPAAATQQQQQLLHHQQAVLPENTAPPLTSTPTTKSPLAQESSTAIRANSLADFEEGAGVGIVPLDDVGEQQSSAGKYHLTVINTGLEVVCF